MTAVTIIGCALALALICWQATRKHDAFVESAGPARDHREIVLRSQGLGTKAEIGFMIAALVFPWPFLFEASADIGVKDVLACILASVIAVVSVGAGLLLHARKVGLWKELRIDAHGITLVPKRPGSGVGRIAWEQVAGVDYDTGTDSSSSTLKVRFVGKGPRPGGTVDVPDVFGVALGSLHTVLTERWEAWQQASRRKP